MGKSIIGFNNLPLSNLSFNQKNSMKKLTTLEYSFNIISNVCFFLVVANLVLHLTALIIFTKSIYTKRIIL